MSHNVSTKDKCAEAGELRRAPLACILRVDQHDLPAVLCQSGLDRSPDGGNGNEYLCKRVRFAAVHGLCCNGPEGLDSPSLRPDTQDHFAAAAAFFRILKSRTHFSEFKYAVDHRPNNLTLGKRGNFL